MSLKNALHEHSTVYVYGLFLFMFVVVCRQRWCSRRNPSCTSCSGCDGLQIVGALSLGKLVVQLHKYASSNTINLLGPDLNSYVISIKMNQNGNMAVTPSL